MRLHSIFQEKKLLWSALLPDAESTCLEPLIHDLTKNSKSPGQTLNSKPGLIQTNHLKTNLASAPLASALFANKVREVNEQSKDHLEHKKLQITSLNEADKKSPDVGVLAKKQAGLSFSGFFSTISNDFILNSQTNKAKLQNVESMGLVLATLVPNAADNVSMPLSPALLHKCKALALDQKVAKGPIRSVNSPSGQVVLVFSSFEKSDLSKALNLFQSYLTSLTNRLTTIKGFQTTVKGRSSNLIANLANLASNPGLGNQSKFSPKIETKSTLSGRVKTQYGLATGNPVADPLGQKKVGSVNTLTGTEMQYSKVVGTLRAIRDLNQFLKLTDIPLPTKLYTVIRSPHVFKKTREQFAMTKVKRTVLLNFKSKAALRLLIDSLILLKLPAEVKAIIRDF